LAQTPLLHSDEQQSVPAAQLSPSTLQVPPVMGAQEPLVHTPVQHSPADAQVCPVATHALAAHWPLTQLALQQSALEPHASPGSRQNDDDVHTAPTHEPPQHGSLSLHGWPAATHMPESGS